MKKEPTSLSLFNPKIEYSITVTCTFDYSPIIYEFKNNNIFNDNITLNFLINYYFHIKERQRIFGQEINESCCYFTTKNDDPGVHTMKFKLKNNQQSLLLEQKTLEYTEYIKNISQIIIQNKHIMPTFKQEDKNYYSLGGIMENYLRKIQDYDLINKQIKEKPGFKQQLLNIRQPQNKI